MSSAGSRRVHIERSSSVKLVARHCAAGRGGRGAEEEEDETTSRCFVGVISVSSEGIASFVAPAAAEAPFEFVDKTTPFTLDSKREVLRVGLSGVVEMFPPLRPVKRCTSAEPRSLSRPARFKAVSDGMVWVGDTHAR